MATSVYEPSEIERGRDGSCLKTGAGSGSVNSMPGGDEMRTVQEYAPPPASTALWVFVASTSMMFAALTSALIVRQGGALDWQHLRLPGILYLNTAVLLVSSATLEIGRRRVAAAMGRGIANAAATWLHLTVGLGLLFVVGLLIAWAQLRAQGIYLATNPSSSFFYLFTAAHGIHFVGGVGGLLRVVLKLKNRSLRRSTLDATARYWHFMDVLWIYVLVLLWIKL